jgi:hypothetical protein
VVVTVSAAVVLAGCGSSSSSTQTKPAYCSNVANLKKTIKSLPSAASGGVSALKSTLATVETEAQSIIPSAKSDFPQQTQALSSSLSQLEKTVKGISGTPSVSEIATLAQQGTATVNAAKSLISATESKCA